MRNLLRFHFIAAVFAMAATGCQIKANFRGLASTTVPHPTVQIVSGNGQSHAVNGALAAPFRVQALDAKGAPMASVNIEWAIASGTGSLSAATTITDASGYAQVTLTLGTASGTRVVTTMGTQGGWAERRAVDLDELAVVPDDIDLGEASTLPVAGVTALRALRRRFADARIVGACCDGECTLAGGGGAIVWIDQARSSIFEAEAF